MRKSGNFVGEHWIGAEGAKALGFSAALYPEGTESGAMISCEENHCDCENEIGMYAHKGVTMSVQSGILNDA